MAFPFGLRTTEHELSGPYCEPKYFLDSHRCTRGRPPAPPYPPALHPRAVPRLIFEPLEPRLLLNADLLLDLGALPGGDQDQNLIVRLFEEQETIGHQSAMVQRVKVLDADNQALVLASTTFAEGQTIVIRTGAGSDEIAIDVGSFEQASDGGAGALPALVIDMGTGEADTLRMLSDEAVDWNLSQIAETGGGTAHASIGEDELSIGFSGVEAFAGGAGVDTLYGPRLALDTEATWVIDGPGSGTVENYAFSSMDHLVGSDHHDLFRIEPGASLPGTIRGAWDGPDRGFDRMVIVRSDFQDVAFEGTPGEGTVTLDGESISYVGLEQIDSVLRVDVSDAPATVHYDVTVELLEEHGERVVVVTDASDPLRRLAEQNLAEISHVAVITGAADDSVTVDLASFIHVLGEDALESVPTFDIDTQAGNDTLSLAAPATSTALWRLQVEGAGTLVAELPAAQSGEPPVSALVLAFRSVERYEGGAGADTLVGPDTASIWEMTAPGTGSVAGHRFEGFEQLVGTSDDDTLRTATQSTDWRVTADQAGEVLSTRFFGMEQLVGSGADTLWGPAENTVWVVDGPNSGRVAGMAFSGMQTLIGADGNQDQFRLGPGAALTGRIEGGAGGLDSLFVDETLFTNIVVTGDAESGRVDLDGTGIAYSGLEPIETSMEQIGDDLVLSGTENDDDLVLRRGAQPGTLVLDSRNAFVADLTFDDPGGTLTIRLGGGDDQLTIEGFGSGLGTSLVIDGGSNSEFGADTIVVAAGALVSTRHLARRDADHVSAFSVDDSGDIVLEAERVHIRPGAKLLTHVVPGSVMQDANGARAPAAGAITVGDADGDTSTLGARSVTIESREVAAFDPTTAVDGATNRIELGPGHALETGAAVRYHAGGGTAIGGLESGRTYYAIFDAQAPAKVRLAETYAKAVQGVALGLNPASATGTGHSLREGAVVDASGEQAGTVTVAAINRPDAVRMPFVDVFIVDADIDIDGATLRGGDVTVSSEAFAVAPAPIPDGIMSGLVGELVSFAHQIPGMVVSMFTGMSAAVSVRTVSATVSLHDTDVESSGSVAITSTAQADAASTALATSVRKTASPLLAAMAFSHASATAETTLTGTTRVVAEGNVTVSSTGSANPGTSSIVSNLIEAVAQRRSPSNFDAERITIDVAVSHSELTVLTKLGEHASIRSRTGNVDILADGSASTGALAMTLVHIDGRMGLTVALTVAQSRVESIVDGTVYAAGDASRTSRSFDPLAASVVDPAADTITLPDHGLSTGDRIVYRAGDAGGGPFAAIEGLVDGETYVVLVVDENTIQLARAAPLDLSPQGADAASKHRLMGATGRGVHVQCRRCGAGCGAARRAPVRDRRRRHVRRAGRDAD